MPLPDCAISFKTLSLQIPFFNPNAFCIDPLFPMNRFDAAYSGYIFFFAAPL